MIADGWGSEAVEDALSLCLACKGCKADCPVGVDVATWKAEFRAHHYADRLRPRVGLFDGPDRPLGAARGLRAGVANAVSRRRAARASRRGNRTARAPAAFASQTFRELVPRPREPGMGADRVLLWPDTFNNHFRPRDR